MKKMIVVTKNYEETIKLGKKIAKCLSVGAVLALNGALGSGKTTFTKGLVEGLFKNSDVKVKSPSFAIVNQYDGSFTVFHIDCYRLEGEIDLTEIGIDEFMFSEGITVIEWAERMQALLPADVINIDISYEEEESGRKFEFFSDNKSFMKILRSRFNA